MEIVGSFLIVRSIFLWCDRKTQTVTFKKQNKLKKKKKRKGLQDNYFWGFVFKLPTCLDDSQDSSNVILTNFLLIAVYWIAL